MKKKFWALVLIAALVCCLLPPQPVVHAESTTAMNFENKNTDESGTGWSWNASSKTLSLSGLDFTCSDGSSLILPAGAIVNLGEMIEYYVRNGCTAEKLGETL